MNTSSRTVQPSATLSQAIVERIHPGANASLTRAFQLVIGVLLLTAGAKIQVLTADWPVPVTLQTLVVLVLGAMYGPVMAVSTVAAYIGLGAAGAPVFATAPFAGFTVLAGPPGGYLAGFLAAAGFVGVAANLGFTRRVVPSVIVMSLGTLIILLLGAIWLWITSYSLEIATTQGFTKFLVTGAIKSVLAALIVTGAWRALAAQPSPSE